MGIWERLGTVIKSYLHDDAQGTRWRSASPGYGPKTRGDPDIEAAFAELDDFLKGESPENHHPGGDSPGFGGGKEAGGKAARALPREIRESFSELALGPEASPEECKTAYKRLLKTHHPDRHARNPEQLKKATEKTARVNAAYGRLEEWFGTLNPGGK